MLLLNWSPPSEYDIPVYINVDMMDGLLASVKESMKAISSTGLIVMSIPLALVIVYIIVKSFTGSNAINQGVRKRSISRKIFKADVDRNMVDILDDKMLHKEVDLLANKNFHSKHKDLLVQDRVNNMEINHLAEQEFNKKFPDASGEKRDMYKNNNDRYYERKQKKGRK